MHIANAHKVRLICALTPSRAQYALEGVRRKIFSRKRWQLTQRPVAKNNEINGYDVENYIELMNDLKDQLSKGRIQKAYRYIFDIFSDLGNEIKNSQNKVISTTSLYHGYLDMTYLPVTTETLKNNGLKIAIVFNYSLFQFEIWLSAVNRKKRIEVIEIISQSKWNKYKTVQNDENTDAIIEITIKGINEFSNKNRIVSLITKETIAFIDNIEEFIQRA
jgi:hypothetical protein